MRGCGWGVSACVSAVAFGRVPVIQYDDGRTAAVFFFRRGPCHARLRDLGVYVCVGVGSKGASPANRKSQRAMSILIRSFPEFFDLSCAVNLD